MGNLVIMNYNGHAQQIAISIIIQLEIIIKIIIM